MKIGEIYEWQTNKAKGYDSRKKMQVFICAGDWRDGNTFLFISSERREGDLLILAKYYNFLRYDSYISCGSIVTYDDGELAAAQPKLLGRLLPADLRALYQAMSQSEVMVERHKLKICGALKLVV